MIGPAVDYLKIFGLVSIGLIWLKFIEISHNKKNNQKEDGFYKSKIDTGKFYITQVLPDTKSLAIKVTSGAESYSEYNDEFFDLGFK